LSNDAGCAARPGTLAESSVPASATGRIGAAAAACTTGIYPGKRAHAVATWIAIGTAGATGAEAAQETVVTLPAIAALLGQRRTGAENRKRNGGQQ
jgi:hypothetical protein